MSMKRAPGCASSTDSTPPGPRTAICERLAPLRLAPKLASESFRVQDAAARTNFQEGSFLKLGPLHGAAGTSAVAGARGARDRVPEVVEPAVRVGGVLVRLLRGDFDRRLVDEDVRIHHGVGD